MLGFCTIIFTMIGVITVARSSFVGMIISLVFMVYVVKEFSKKEKTK